MHVILAIACNHLQKRAGAMAFVKVAGNGIIYWSGWQFKLEFQIWEQWLQHRCRRLEFGTGRFQTGNSGRSTIFYLYGMVLSAIEKSQSHTWEKKVVTEYWDAELYLSKINKSAWLCYILYLSESIHSLKEVNPERQYEVYGELWPRKKQQGTEETDAKNLHRRVRRVHETYRGLLYIVFEQNFKKIRPTRGRSHIVFCKYCKYFQHSNIVTELLKWE
jgi:hypothetical protein